MYATVRLQMQPPGAAWCMHARPEGTAVGAEETLLLLLQVKLM
jgi:hypothetical protein